MMRRFCRKAVQLTSAIFVILFFNFFLSVWLRSEGDSDGVPQQALVAGSPRLDMFRRQDSSFVAQHPSLYRKIAELSRGERSVQDPDKDVHPVNNLAQSHSTTHRPKLGVSVGDTNSAHPTELSDIFISVKTTKRYHAERLELLLQTWVTFAQDVTYFFTDADDEEYSKKTRGHLINTNCTADHTRQALCCKMSVEYDYFIASNKRWFCHVDDDTYLNTNALLHLLRKKNHTQDWYLGKPSLSHPLKMQDRDNPGQSIAFWFATGGAGFCISRGLALKMMPFTSGGRLRSVCNHIRLPDDCSIGYIISQKLNKELTVVKEFHSHLEGLWKVNEKQLEKQITLSYVYRTDTRRMNVINLRGFHHASDPTRFRSIHCYLYPNTPNCPQR